MEECSASCLSSSAAFNEPEVDGWLLLEAPGIIADFSARYGKLNGAGGVGGGGGVGGIMFVVSGGKILTAEAGNEIVCAGKPAPMFREAELWGDAEGDEEELKLTHVEWRLERDEEVFQ